MPPLTGHEKECALAAIAVRIEAAEKTRDKVESKQWRKFYREIIDAPPIPLSAAAIKR